MQAYMRDQVVALAQRPTKQEAVEEIEAVLARGTSEEPDAAAVREDLDAERR